MCHILEHQADRLLHCAAPDHVHHKGAVVPADLLHNGYLTQEFSLELVRCVVCSRRGAEGGSGPGKQWGIGHKMARMSLAYT